MHSGPGRAVLERVGLGGFMRDLRRGKADSKGTVVGGGRTDMYNAMCVREHT